MQILKYTMILLFAVGLMSCGGGDDEKVDGTKPTITLTSPTGSTAVVPGDILNVNATLADNVELKEYTLTVSYSGTKSVKNVEEFSFNSYTDSDAYGNELPFITGKKTADLNFDIAIKDNARAGLYTFTLSVKDKSGNGSEETVQFEIARS